LLKKFYFEKLHIIDSIYKMKHLYQNKTFRFRKSKLLSREGY